MFLQRIIKANRLLEIANTFRHKFRNTNTVNYDFEKLLKNDDHHLNAMIGHEWIVTKSKKLTNTVHGFPESFTSQDAWKYSTQGTPYSIDNYLNPDDKLLSFFGRINYDYKSKYFVECYFPCRRFFQVLRRKPLGLFPFGSSCMARVFRTVYGRNQELAGRFETACFMGTDR